MRILARMAPLYGADRFIEVTRAHIDGIVYEGNAGLAFAERLADLGGSVRVPTSLNVMSMDRTNWRQLGQKCRRSPPTPAVSGMPMFAWVLKPTFTCAPYQTELAPVFGEQIAWSESNAVAYANSVIGARTNRYGDYLDISCALTGRVPAAGFHLTENRRGTHWFELRRHFRIAAAARRFLSSLGLLSRPNGDERSSGGRGSDGRSDQRPTESAGRRGGLVRRNRSFSSGRCDAGSSRS